MLGPTRGTKRRSSLGCERCLQFEVLEDAPDDSRILDQRNHPHRPRALEAFQGIGFVELAAQPRPGSFRASRKLMRWHLDRQRQSGASWEIH